MRFGEATVLKTRRYAYQANRLPPHSRSGRSPRRFAAWLLHGRAMPFCEPIRATPPMQSNCYGITLLGKKR